MAITNGFSRRPNTLLIREGVSKQNLKGTKWTEVFDVYLFLT
jgi:hypothetical protein